MKPSNLMRTRSRERGAQLLELALALPFLLVLVAGVADFAQAWNVRQILVNAARDGARLGANQHKLDLTNTDPTTIQHLCQQVAAYLAQENIDLSFMGMSGASSSSIASGCSSPGTLNPNGTAVPEAYTYYQSGTTYGLKIEPAMVIPPTGMTGGPIDATRVTLRYPYTWAVGFNHIVRLLGSSAYASPIPIQVDATVGNLTN